jgi:hypothetical protein
MGLDNKQYLSDLDSNRDPDGPGKSEAGSLFTEIK